jgi:hypothetical protein
MLVLLWLVVLAGIAVIAVAIGLKGVVLVAGILIVCSLMRRGVRARHAWRMKVHADTDLEH